MSNQTPLLLQNEKAEDEALLETEADSSSRQTRQTRRTSIRTRGLSKMMWPVIWFFQILLLTLSATMLYIATSRLQDARDSMLSDISQWSPGLEAVEYESRTFRGSLYHLSPWKGAPDDELDALWYRVGQIGAMSITSDEVERLGKDPTLVVKWPEEAGGGHVASVEVFHHLHCLNFIRKSTYRAYYNDKDISFTESEAKIRRHQDHCIDMIRQAIMCTGDVGLMTYNWVKDNSQPYPDFDTNHRCRNFDRLLEWGENTAVKGPAPQAFNDSDRLGIRLLDGD